MATYERVWMITGAARGFGEKIALGALEHGDAVVATARNPRAVRDAFGDRPGLLAAALDVTDPQQAASAAAAAVERFGRIDVLVNNAGYGLMGAVEGLSEALYDELAPLGIRVTVVEPGYFRTDFLDGTSLQKSEAEIDDYAATAGVVRTRAATLNHEQPGDPDRLARAILTLVVTDRGAPPGAAGGVVRLCVSGGTHGWSTAHDFDDESRPLARAVAARESLWPCATRSPRTRASGKRTARA